MHVQTNIIVNLAVDASRALIPRCHLLLGMPNLYRNQRNVVENEWQLVHLAVPSVRCGHLVDLVAHPRLRPASQRRKL